MTVCFIIATIISCLSIFVFFGKAFQINGSNVVPSMFNLMFGGKASLDSYHTIEWKTYGGMIFLFVVQVLLIVVAIVMWILCYEYADEVYIMICGGASALLSLLALILSFCAIAIVGADGTGIKLGFGPIFYSIVQIISILFIAGGFAYYRFVEVPEYFEQSQLSETSKSKASIQSAETHKEDDKVVMPENEKVELLTKYKNLLDSGVITQEEFEKKKKEIL